MALLEIDHFNKVTKDRSRVHEPADATFSIIYEGDKKYLQIDTYGSADRQIKGKVSQSIQMDKEMAQRIVEILKMEFYID